MKKVVFAVILTLCVAGVFVWLRGDQVEGVTAADCLPSDVLFYAEQHELTDMYQDFSKSRLGRTLSRIDYLGIAAQIGEAGNGLVEAQAFWLKVNTALNDPVFDKLLGKECSIALFPANSFAAENPAHAIEERLLLIARPRYGSAIVELIAPLLSKDIKQSTVQFGSHTITRYFIDKDNTVSTAFVGGLLLAGLEERLVRKSLDHYDSGKNTLQLNTDYQKLRSGFEGAQLFSYLSIPALISQGRMLGQSLEEKERAEFMALLNQWQGWGAAAYGGWHENDLVRDKAEILFNKKELDNRVARLCDVKPGVNDTLAFVPRDTLLYYWTNTINLPLLWDLYSSSATQLQPHAIDILSRELRDSAGVELEDVLGMIGNEFAVIMKDVAGEGIPLPKVSVAVKLKEPEKFLQVFKVLLENADIPVSQEQYNGQEISYWGLAPQGALQPAYALLNDYLVISNSLDLLQQLVDLNKDSSSSLAKSPVMKVFGNDLLENNNSATYVHIAKLADSLKDIATWAGSMAVLQGPDAARNADVLVNQLLLPFLDGIAMYTQLGSRSYIGDESIIMESTTTIVQ